MNYSNVKTKYCFRNNLCVGHIKKKNFREKYYLKGKHNIFTYYSVLVQEKHLPMHSSKVKKKLCFTPSTLCIRKVTPRRCELLSEVTKH